MATSHNKFEKNIPSNTQRRISLSRTKDHLFRKTTLANGLRVISEEVPASHSLAIGVWINVGSQHESPQQNGISHFIEHAVFKGTRRRKTHQIAQYLESVGGYVNAFTSKEQTCYYARVMDVHLGRAIDLLSDIVLNPVFHQREIEKEKLVIIEEMRASEDEPEEIIHDYFERLIFSPHPLGQTIIGTEENIRSFSQTDLIEFCRSYYTCENILISAAGKIDHNRLVEEVDRAFAPAPAGKTEVHTHMFKRSGARSEKICKPIQQVHACFGNVIPGIHHPHRYAMFVLNTLLGDGMSSRLFQTIRERYGYAYSIFSFLTLMKEAGVFGIYFGTEKNNTEHCFELIREELHALRSKRISGRELHRAKEQVKGNLLLGLESTTNKMMHVARDEIYFQKYEPIESVLSDIDALTVGEIHAAAEMICDLENFSTTLLVPQE